MQDALRCVIKQLVKRAVVTTTIHKSVNMAELERAQSILFKMAVEAKSKMHWDITKKQGTVYMSLLYFQNKLTFD